MRRKMLNFAKGVAKTPFKVSRGILKHRRKIVGGTMAAGMALTGLAKKNPALAVKVVKGGIKGLQMASNAVKYVKR